ncbi:hypothetical protein KY084_00045 [Stakelama sp. CBK3Z-3]|uniref:Uncharacterized protein n=1 Tax=Stakelama flava TaxID=2860338 RepID=A0ABS6XGA3_9SPHN|nr:hypothetical protein [Stakelama flava]MBW4329267.1 hypothetical protein [Stakelama flava]
MNHFVRSLCLPLLPLCALSAAAPAWAKSSPFDLAGPRLHVAVTHDGVTLPVEWVPNLSEGDRISIKLDRQAEQSTRYRLIAAFLRGVTDRPPRDWFHDAKSWERKKNSLSLIVPAGAHQVAVFVMPEDGGDVDAVIDTVRKRPGTFVRATKELNQASLDRARLDAFLRDVRAVERDDPKKIADTSQALTRSLSIKLNSDCLRQPVDVQAACLTDDRETMLLSDTHSSALTSTLVGAPTDLAFQLSATPQGGSGYYSSYIGVVRDIFRIFGAFQSTELQYIPALSQLNDGKGDLLLNAPLSFGKPTSVMVAALPAVEAPTPPPLRPVNADQPLCAATGLVLPMEGAPLVYATHYARNLTLRLEKQDGGMVTVPLVPDARSGGFVVRGPLPLEGVDSTIKAQVHGDWGFTPFDGPVFSLSNPNVGAWKTRENASLVVGRDNNLILDGGAAACVTSVEMRQGSGGAQPVKWSLSDARTIALDLPLSKASPGPVTLTIDAKGVEEPQTVTLPALDEAGRIDRLTLHAGDDQAILDGTRLDQVRSVTLGDVMFKPGTLSRDGKTDRLTLNASDSASVERLSAGQRLHAQVAMAGGRHMKVDTVIASPRPQISLLRISAHPPSDTQSLPIELSSENIIAQDADMTFAFHLADGQSLTGDEKIEVADAKGAATAMLTTGKGYDLQDGQTGIVSFTPRASLGPVVRGPIRFRLVRGDTASDWVPLATLVRLPEISSVDCASVVHCTLTGKRLFLIESIAANKNFSDAAKVPDGFTTSSIQTPAAPDGTLFLKLRDAPDAVATLQIAK